MNELPLILENGAAPSESVSEEPGDSASQPEAAAPHEQSPRDRVEILSAANFAGVSDRGLRHHDNQDSLALATVEILVSPIDVPPIYIAVVCDGVSSSESGASASEVAAQSILKSVQRAMTLNPSANAQVELRQAIRQAHQEVCAIACGPNTQKDPPATTVAAAVVQDSMATISWIGDSRVYWITETEAGVLTRDDSWINAMIDAGRMTEEEAQYSENQSALFRCLGGEAGAEIEQANPSFTTIYMQPGMRLLLCSDGFWNYANTADEVAKLVRQTPHEDPLRTAKHLVNFAIVGGGHDNITVAVLAM